MPAQPGPKPRHRRARRAVTAVAILGVLTAGILTLGAAASTPRPAASFEGWGSWNAGGADVEFIADKTTAHAGGQSLRITSHTGLVSGSYGAISQGLAATPSTKYEFRMWVKAKDAPADSAFVVYGSAPAMQEFLPSESTNWQEVIWTYTTGPSENVIPLAIAVQDKSMYWIDDVSVRATRAAASIVVNGGFEQSENVISIDRDDMFFESGDVEIPVASSADSVDWTVRDERGDVVESGTVDTSADAATLEFSSYEPGYYALDLTGVDVERATSFAIIDGLNTPVDTESSRFGTTLHPAIHPGIPQADMAASLGLGQVRLDLRWESIETSPGQYDWDPVTDAEVERLVALGIRPVLIAAYYGPYDDGRTPHSAEGIAGYADFVGAAAEHYGPDVDIEIYNEYNLGYSNSICGQTASCYMQLLEPAAAAIRAAEPGVRIIGPVIGGLTSWWLTSNESYDWLAEFLALGGAAHIDILSMHSYAAPSAPEGHNEQVVARIKALMAQYPAAQDLPLWLTETGYHTIGVESGGVSELMQARYLVRDVALSLAQGLDVYMIYGMLDDWPDPFNSEANFGLVRNPAGQLNLLAPKPAFVTHAVLTRQLEGRSYASTDITPGDSHSVVFSGAGKNDVRIMWATTDAALSAMASGPVTVTDQFGRSRMITPLNGKLHIPLTEDAVYVTGPGLRIVPST